MKDFIELPVNKLSLAKKKLIYGVGINDANYQVSSKINGKQILCPYYKVWKSMLLRCYSNTYQKNNTTYIGCSVCNSWLIFSNFKEWMMLQDWKDKELDKDIIIDNNKEYSPNTCMFISKRLNRFFNLREHNRGILPLGVCYNKNSIKKYTAQCCDNTGKSIYLGSFVTENEAYKKYISFKNEIILKMIQNETNVFIINKLLKLQNKLKEI